jgi:hypothetical protein
MWFCLAAGGSFIDGHSKHTELEELWRSRLKEAQLRWLLARNTVKDAQRDLAFDDPDTAVSRLALQKALHAENIAVKEYRRVVAIFKDLLVDGRIPEEDGGPREGPDWTSGQRRPSTAFTRESEWRRLSRRYAIKTAVQYLLIYEDRVVKMGAGLSVNLSSTGILFESSERLPPGMRVELQIAWPALRDESVRLTLHARGRTVRSWDRYTAVEISQHRFVQMDSKVCIRAESELSTAGTCSDKARNA